MGNRRIQLRIAALVDTHRVEFDADVRGNPFVLDPPLSFRRKEAEKGHDQAAAVDQRWDGGDADQAAPGALADQGPSSSRLKA